MSTVNGFGTLHYDWQRNQDGTANATTWFVIFFLPVVPMGRRRVRVSNAKLRRSGLLAILGGLMGYGRGFETEMQTLESVPNPIWRILRTYLLAYLVVPALAFAPPILLMLALLTAASALNLDTRTLGGFLALASGIAGMIWVSVLIALILDRAAGRHHVAPSKNKYPSNPTPNNYWN